VAPVQAVKSYPVQLSGRGDLLQQFSG